MSHLLDALREKRGTLAERWAELVFATYPRQSVPFLRQEKDPFKNPLGATVRNEIAALAEALLAGAGADTLAGPLDAIVRLRAVQSFGPAEAVRFVFQFKQAVAEIIGTEGVVAAADELGELHARLDELALQAFDIYVRCREKVFELRAREATARTYSLLKKAGLLAEAGEAGDPPAGPSVEGRS